MTAQAAQNVIAQNVFAEIAVAEKTISTFKGAAKENSEAANLAKVGAYAVLVASLSGVRLAKGNLPRAVSNQVRKGLLENAGVKEAVAKKYLENSVGLLRKMDIPTQATPEMVKELILAENLTSESKIAKYVTGEIEKDELRILAEKLVGRFTTRKTEDGERVPGVFKPSDFTDEDFNRFDDILRELKAARKAAEAAAIEAEAKLKGENAEMDAVLDAMDGHQTAKGETESA